MCGVQKLHKAFYDLKDRIKTDQTLLGEGYDKLRKVCHRFSLFLFVSDALITGFFFNLQHLGTLQKSVDLTEGSDTDEEDDDAADEEEEEESVSQAEESGEDDCKADSARESSKTKGSTKSVSS